METMTLTDFLLARIAEDEAPTGYDGPHWSDCESPFFSCTCGLPDRMEREREARRRIVERCRWVEEHPEWGSDMELAGDWENCRATLRDLAAAYADHPDYRQEWRG